MGEGRHTHAGIEFFVWAGLSGVLMLSLFRIGGGLAARSNNPMLQKLGASLGAVS